MRPAWCSTRRDDSVCLCAREEVEEEEDEDEDEDEGDEDADADVEVEGWEGDEDEAVEGCVLCRGPTEDEVCLRNRVVRLCGVLCEPPHEISLPEDTDTDSSGTSPGPRSFFPSPPPPPPPLPPSLPPPSTTHSPAPLLNKNTSATPFHILCAFSFLIFFLSTCAILLALLFSALLNNSSTSPTPIPAPTHHHHPKKLCQSTTAHISPGIHTNWFLLGMYRNVIADDISASIIAPAPNAAVPPSVRQACFRFTSVPQRKSEVVKSSESVALQMF